MKTLLAAFFSAFAFTSLSAHAGTPIINLSVGGEISPGVYGQVQFGNASPPRVLYAQPMMIDHQPPGVVVAPMYLHVPPGYARHWARHCHEYDACDRPVYFVEPGRYQPDSRNRHDNEYRNKHRRDHGDEHRGDREDRDHERRHMGDRERGDRGRDSEN